MDLAFSKEEIAFREEVRAFFRDNVPPETCLLYTSDAADE